MAQAEDIFLRAKHRTFRGLTEDIEHEWTGPFYFIQAADPQLGLMKAWREGDCDSGGDEWTEEVDLTKQAVAAMNQLRPRPRFMVLCGDLVHAMPGTIFRDDQERDLKMSLSGTDPSIPLVFVSGNHDLGNTPTPKTVAQYCSAWGDDYFSFWVGGVLFLVLNSQLFYDASACPQLKESQETWLEEQLSKMSYSSSTAPKHIIVFQHIPLYIKNHDEEDGYFNLQREVRQKLIDRFKKAAVVAGHTTDSWENKEFRMPGDPSSQGREDIHLFGIMKTGHLLIGVSVALVCQQIESCWQPSKYPKAAPNNWRMQAELWTLL
ncbi:serine/threonine-protein phosphatase CPPED1 isoform X1 [Entelurus aequoreus]|uniref:serine/threonine-protein phosphatase CPPED1 isoform X1 n=1 Tax=Entelurus aequoreus TaxID=161455 RepID=UPI002B1E0640|nr:serine/threonine-protein phosphatase CPPED1 isoform X1 [Entelurus aequoreus]